MSEQKRPSNASLVDRIITPDFLQRIETLMAVMQHTSDVYKQVYLPRSTFYAWYAAGKILYDRGPFEMSPREGKLRNFYLAVRNGRERGKFLDLHNIHKAGEKSWRAAAWRLERRYPDEWGRNRPKPDKAKREAEQQEHRAAGQELLAELARTHDQDIAAARAERDRQAQLPESVGKSAVDVLDHSTRRTKQARTNEPALEVIEPFTEVYSQLDTGEDFGPPLFGRWDG